MANRRAFFPSSLRHGIAALRPRVPRRDRSDRKRSPAARLRVRKRPPAPPFWIDIAPDILRNAPSDAAMQPHSPAERHRQWRLVLDAKHIPWRSFEKGAFSLYVPPIATLAAYKEIRDFESEKATPPLPAFPAKKGAYWIVALLAALIAWHKLRWIPALEVPFLDLPHNPETWLRSAGLDAMRVTRLHEWWRCVTALTLHADTAHIVSNVVMGGIFGIPLCRRTGVGFGFLLTILAGALGNLATAYARSVPHMSQGFSTALFASVGLLAALTAIRTVRHIRESEHADAGYSPSGALRKALFQGALPLGAGLGILAMFGGSEAPRVDYLAHVMGLFAGISLGLITGGAAPGLFVLRGNKDAVFQTLSLAGAGGLITVCWITALRATG